MFRRIGRLLFLRPVFQVCFVTLLDTIPARTNLAGANVFPLQALHKLPVINAWLHARLLMAILSLLLRKLHNIPTQPNPHLQEDKRSG